MDLDVGGSADPSQLLPNALATIKKSGASVVGCSRMGTRRGGGVQLLKQLTEQSALGSYSFCGALEAGGDHGVAILTEYPILEERTLWFEPRKPDSTSLHQWCAGSVREPR